MSRAGAAFIVSLTCLNGVSSAATYSEEQEKAVLATNSLTEWQHDVATVCTGHLTEGLDSLLPFLSYFWQADELKHTMMRDLAWPAIPENKKAESLKYGQRVQAKLASSDEGARTRVCNWEIASFSTRISHLEARSPDDARVLDTMFDAHPELHSQWRKAQYVAGCVKANFDFGGRILDAAMSACDCQASAMLAAATPGEIDAWSNEPDIEKKPWYQRARPAIEACWAKSAAGRKSYSYPASDGDITLRFPAPATVTPRQPEPSIKSARCYSGTYLLQTNDYVLNAMIVDCPAYDLGAESVALVRKTAEACRQLAAPVPVDSNMRDVLGYPGKAKEMTGAVGSKRLHCRVFVRPHSVAMLLAALDSGNANLTEAANAFLDSL